MFTMKKSLSLFIGLSLSAISVSSFAQTDKAALNEEMAIMSNIMKTSFSHSSRDASMRIRGIDSTYLAGQGAVFTISVRNNRGFSFGDFSFHSDDVHFIQEPPEPPEAPAIYASSLEALQNGEFEDLIESAVEMATEALEESRDRLRELREREREYAWEERGLERELKDLEFALRNLEDDDRQKVQTRKTQLQASLDSLRKRKKEIEDYATELREEQEIKLKEQNAARQKEYARFIGQFEDRVSDMLCKYGAGLRAIDKSENVSFILSNIGDGKGGKQDRIYVFGLENVQKCVRGNVSEEKLLENAESYLF